MSSRSIEGSLQLDVQVLAAMHLPSRWSGVFDLHEARRLFGIASIRGALLQGRNGCADGD
jgi:hypothetical protein